MNKAVLLSLQSANKDGGTGAAEFSENPHYKERTNNLPAGLKNVGNTCMDISAIFFTINLLFFKGYINSLLQTYFSIPEFRKFLLNYPYKTTAPSTDANIHWDKAAFECMEINFN